MERDETARNGGVEASNRALLERVESERERRGSSLP